jgi:uncharacterized protein
MLRTSSYVIYVDLPGSTQEMLLVHGYSGAYDKVSRRIARFLRKMEARKPPKPLYGAWSDDLPEEAAEGGEVSLPEHTLQVLQKRGYLTDKSLEQEEEDFKAFVGRVHEVNMRAVPNYMFIVTYNCNLRCGYCFQDHMRTNENFRHLLPAVDRPMVDRFFKAMPEIESRHGIEQGNSPLHRKMGFFGGEPFLARNRPLVEYIINRTLAIGTGSFWAVSNGTELEAYEDLLSRELISSIQITLDGPPEQHDKRRIYADGSGSFEKIARNITMCLERGVRIELRMNMDRSNIDQVPKLADEIVARGWSEFPRFMAYASPIVAQNPAIDRKSTFNTWQLDQKLAEMREEHENLYVIGRPDDGIRSKAFDLFANPGHVGPTFRESFCSAHSKLYLFDAFGDIYTCWEHTGDPKIRIGHVHEDGRLDMQIQTEALWRSRTVASNPVCSKCRYALQCGGGCAAIAMTQTGKFLTNYCDGFGQRFRASVADAYLDHLAKQARALAHEQGAEIVGVRRLGYLEKAADREVRA